MIYNRRDGGEMAALHLAQELKQRKYDVFFDRGDPYASRFDETLWDNIRSCKDFILVLTPHALDRCENEVDWVRFEIEEALRNGKNIVPVVMSGFEFPENLPESIDEIRHINALVFSMDFFKESIERLCSHFLLSKPARPTKLFIPPGRRGHHRRIVGASWLWPVSPTHPAEANPRARGYAGDKNAQKELAQE